MPGRAGVTAGTEHPFLPLLQLSPPGRRNILFIRKSKIKKEIAPSGLDRMDHLQIIFLKCKIDLKKGLAD